MHMIMKTPSILAAIVLTLGTSLHAQVLNGTFDTDLTDWTALGDAGVRDAAAFLTTATSNFPPGDDGLVNFNYSGNDIVDSFTLETGMSVGAGTLDPDPLNGIFAFEGSFIQQNVFLDVGEFIQFDYNFFTNETSGADYAFILYDTTLTTIASVASAVNAGSYGYTSAVSSGLVAFYGAPVAAAGFYVVTIGIVDAGNDGLVSSALQLDNIVAIPEPTAASLALAGAAVLGLLRRRRSA